MAIPEDRLSTTVVPSLYLDPDNRPRTATTDWEKGPFALNDPSRGLSWQVWALSWESGTGNFIATPESVGVPSIVLNALNVTQCSFAFDQNGHINIVYMVNGTAAFLHWYDTNQANWTTTALGAGTFFPMLQLDDKRVTQTDSSDLMLWYTKQQPDLSWNLYKREQRERFETEDLMQTDVFPYCFKVGMHSQLRTQITLRSAPY